MLQFTSDGLSSLDARLSCAEPPELTTCGRCARAQYTTMRDFGGNRRRLRQRVRLVELSRRCATKTHLLAKDAARYRLPGLRPNFAFMNSRVQTFGSGEVVRSSSR